jgi:hypothetical protein
MPSYGPGPSVHDYIKVSTNNGSTWDILGDLCHDPQFEIPGATGGPSGPGWCWYEGFIMNPGLPSPLCIDLKAYDFEPSVLIAWNYKANNTEPSGIFCVDDVHVDGTFGPLYRIEVTPNPATVTVGEIQQFTATAYNQGNITIPGVTFTWSTNVGVVNSNGFFTAQTTPGTGTVTATNGTVSGSATVDVVVGALDYITVTPNQVTINVGGTQQFNVTAYDFYNNTIPGFIWYSWTTDVGIVNSTGFFTAQLISGSGVVTATNGTVSDSAVVNVVVMAPLPATNVHAELTGTNDVTIYWDLSGDDGAGVNDVDHYDIYYITNNWDPTGDAYSLLNIAGPIPAGTTSFVHVNRGKNNAGSYCYQLRTYDTTGYETRTLIQAAKYGRTLLIAQSDWWLLSSCVIQSNTSLEHVIQGQGMPGAWDYAMAWDSATNRWISHIDGRPPVFNDLTDISNEMGFWLHTTENARFTTAGYIVNTSINLTAGWNLVGYPTLNNTETVENALRDTGADAVMVCDPAEPYRIKEVGPTYVMKPGEGYWVHVPADTVWVVDW